MDVSKIHMFNKFVLYEGEEKIHPKQIYTDYM